MNLLVDPEEVAGAEDPDPRVPQSRAVPRWAHGGISSSSFIPNDQRGVILYPITVNGLRFNPIIGNGRPL